jgi:hypothetical protein
VSDQCYLYLIAPADAGRPVKIGIAADPSARLRQLQTGNPAALELVETFWALTREQAAYWEMLAHKLFEAKRMAGEWFDCEASDIAASVHAWRLDREPRAPAARRLAQRFNGALEEADYEAFHPVIPAHLRGRSTFEMTPQERLAYWACFGLSAPPAGFDDWYIVGSPSSGVLCAFPIVAFNGDGG